MGLEEAMSRQCQVRQTLLVQGPHFQNGCHTGSFQTVLSEVRSELLWYSAGRYL